MELSPDKAVSSYLSQRKESGENIRVRHIWVGCVVVVCLVQARTPPSATYSLGQVIYNRAFSAPNKHQAIIHAPSTITYYYNPDFKCTISTRGHTGT